MIIYETRFARSVSLTEPRAHATLEALDYKYETYLPYFYISLHYLKLLFHILNSVSVLLQHIEIEIRVD